MKQFSNRIVLVFWSIVDKKSMVWRIELWWWWAIIYIIDKIWCFNTLALEQTGRYFADNISKFILFK